MTAGAVGSEGAPPSETHVLLGWGVVFIITVGVFIGTLVLRPKPAREAE